MPPAHRGARDKVAHTEGLPPVPFPLTKPKGSGFQGRTALALCFKPSKSPTACTVMHLCLNWPSPLMGTSRSASQGCIYLTLLGSPGSCLSQSNTEKRSLLPANRCKSLQTPQRLTWRQGPGRRLESEISPAEVRGGWEKGAQQARPKWAVCVCVCVCVCCETEEERPGRRARAGSYPHR